MKNLLVISVVFTVSACGMVRAQDSAAAARPYKIAKMESVKVLKGVVVSVNAAANTVIVKSWQAHDTLVVDENTGFTAGFEETVRLADFKAGEGVTVYYKLRKSKKTALKIIKIFLRPATQAPAAGAEGK
jgi:hypothetical protein